uniref:Putative secreted protein n=1 Tax=Anopheles triannulatus TaxID=58253 RepID=A0A2M4B2G6_9DIPT
MIRICGMLASCRAVLATARTRATTPRRRVPAAVTTMSGTIRTLGVAMPSIWTKRIASISLTIITERSANDTENVTVSGIASVIAIVNGNATVTGNADIENVIERETGIATVIEIVIANESVIVSGTGTGTGTVCVIVSIVIASGIRRSAAKAVIVTIGMTVLVKDTRAVAVPVVAGTRPPVLTDTSIHRRRTGARVRITECTDTHRVMRSVRRLLPVPSGLLRRNHRDNHHRHPHRTIIGMAEQNPPYHLYLPPRSPSSMTMICGMRMARLAHQHHPNRPPCHRV